MRDWNDRFKEVIHAVSKCPFHRDTRCFQHRLRAGHCLGGSGSDTPLGQDADGIQNEGEPGLAGITVNLLNAERYVTDSTTTDGDG